jgi:hypothetical protein
MTYSRTAALAATLSLAITSMSIAPAFAAPMPTVVELFTSQGCSSCPPANANLISLAAHPDVLALSFSVTYWDQLGWKDSFGKPEFTARQYDYEPDLGKPGPYTPQMVINGQTTAVGNRLSEVEGLIEQAAPLSGPPISIEGNSVHVGMGTVPASGADVWLVRYDPNVVEVPIARGENAGSTLPHTHVVHALQRLGAWDGSALALDVPLAENGLRTAILLQGTRGGPILAAASN